MYHFGGFGIVIGRGISIPILLAGGVLGNEVGGRINVAIPMTVNGT